MSSLPVLFNQHAAGQALARLDSRATLERNRIEHEGNLQVARIQAVGNVGVTALQATALVSEVEFRLGQLCPGAVSRLQPVGDGVALAIYEVVADTPRRVR